MRLGPNGYTDGKAESRKTKRKIRITRHLGSSGGEANPDISPPHPPSEYGSETTMISDIGNDPTVLRRVAEFCGEQSTPAPAGVGR